jgi:hypothetical protein
MVIVGGGYLRSLGIVGLARGKSGERVSGTEDENGSGDGRYLSSGWMLMDSRVQALYLRSRMKHSDRRVRPLAVGSNDLGDQ